MCWILLQALGYKIKDIVTIVKESRIGRCKAVIIIVTCELHCVEVFSCTCFIGDYNNTIRWTCMSKTKKNYRCSIILLQSLSEAVSAI